jgi:hypothetical protein
MNTTRASIAEALSTVDGVKGYAERPTVIKPGDSWPLVDVLNRGPGSAFETTWRVLVLIGNDVGTATDRMDSLIPDVTQALQPVLYVDSARPIAIATAAGDMFGAEIFGRSE